ncbi:thiamine pyrophosphate-dependent enzyme [Pseudonocardia acaciae]|uniref:thiamine pyrophosphate-dependent enzyme n=1 Tax=Pseudonocardia acaciae TaxID=551276 RepID=UPI00048B07C0|nr:thiamine pyrophosphate-dependent enzyme [Pseudonocardia acaciae]
MSSRRTAGAAIVAQLEALGVRRAYGVPGESYLEVLDALHDSPIHTVVCRQEGGAGFMALAEARLTGGPGVAMVTRGPGAANAAIAVHTAWQDAVPLVLLVGLVPADDRDRESFQEFSPAGWFGSTAKKVLTVERPERAAAQVAEAFAVASSGRPGPVVVGLPEDVLVGPATASPVPARAVADGAVSAAQRDRLGALLDAARRPLVIVGGSRWTADGADAAAVAGWAARRGLPVATDWRCQDIVDHDSPAYVGWLGYGRDQVLADALDAADLLLFVGCGYGDVLSGGYRGGAPDAVTVVVDPAPELSTHQRRVDLHLLASPAAFAAAVAEDGGGGEPDPDWAKRLRAAAVRFATPASGSGTGQGVDLDAAMAALSDRLEPDAVVTYGAGNHALWAQRFLPHHGPGTLLAPRNGAMGFGVPAAVAACLVHPGRQVVSVAGDGCFLMNGQELATAVAYGASPVILVADNSQYGTIREHQERHHPGRVSGTALVNPDFGAFARSFGAHGERVWTTGDLPAALDRAFASGTAAVLHLDVDPAVLAPRGAR